MNQSDEELMAAIAEGDGQAFRLLINRYQAPLLRFVARLLSNETMAEDVVQATFLAVWRNAENWEPKAKLSTWLFTIARRRAIDVARQRKVTLDPEEVILVDTSPKPDRQLATQQTRNAVQAAIDRLPERQKAAILLVHHEGLSGAEASQVLDVTGEALESLLARGRRTLKAALAPRREDLLVGEEA